MSCTLVRLLDQWNSADKALRAYRAEEFPERCVVDVQCSRYHGQGIVTNDHSCPPDSLAVLLSNDHVWWYPIDSCTRVRSETLWRKWITDKLKTIAEHEERYEKERAEMLVR